MDCPHIATGKHMESVEDPRFRINTAPGVMEPKHRVNEAHGSYLQRHQAAELRDELDAWIEANPTVDERVERIILSNIGDVISAPVAGHIARDLRRAGLLDGTP